MEDLNIDIPKLSELARIRLGEEEAVSLEKDLKAIVRFVAQVRQAPREALQSAETGEHYNVFREDSGAHARAEFSDALLSAAAEREARYITVKKIL